MARAVSMTAQDKKWQAESDARALAEAQEITANRQRAKAAVQAAERLEREAKKTVAAARKQTHSPRKTGGKKGGKKK